MKQFNLKEFLDNPNRKVITRCGEEVKIICTDRKYTGYPIVALICKETNEEIECYTENGEHSKGQIYNTDLFFAPEKKKGWVNLYDLSEGPYLGRVYSSKEVAESMIKNCGLHPYIATVKIEWEE